MGRPCTTGTGKKPKKYQRVGKTYAHKKAVLDYIDEGNILDDTIAHFYGPLSREQIRSKKKQINKWRKAENTATINAACADGRGEHLNLRQAGQGTVLTKGQEEQLVVWVNSLRKDGAPVSRTMLRLQALELAKDIGLGDKFTATDTWINLFLRRHKLSLRARTRQGQTTPADAVEAANQFQALVRQTIVEQRCVRVFNADQTAVCYEYLPRTTITPRGSKTVWVKCGNKDKERATVMLLGDSDGHRYAPFMIFKSTPAKKAATQRENDRLRNGFGARVWQQIQALHDKHQCQIYGNRTAWWNSEISLKFLEFHFTNRDDRHENVLLLWDDFSAHWTPEVVAYAASINVITVKVPPRYTYVCQPADVAWNKPFKGRLRGLWVDRLRTQLAIYNSGADERQRRLQQLDDALAAAQIQRREDDAAQLVAERERVELGDAFKLTPPTRSDIVEWVMASWSALTTTTIVSGFARTGLLNDNRPTAELEDLDTDVAPIVEQLEKLRATSDTVESDDDMDSNNTDGELAQ